MGYTLRICGGAIATFRTLRWVRRRNVRDGFRSFVEKPFRLRLGRRGYRAIGSDDSGVLPLGVIDAFFLKLESRATPFGKLHSFNDSVAALVAVGGTCSGGPCL